MAGTARPTRKLDLITDDKFWIFERIENKAAGFGIEIK